jgi:hypothetical protein
MARILTAVAPDTEERVRLILTGHELIFVNDLPTAEAALEGDLETFKLIFVGARFDESRMFDLLEHIRRNAQHRKIPVVAAIVGVTTMSPSTVAGLAHATKVFGASVFINLNDFADNDKENARIRLVVEALVLPPDVVPVVVDAISQRS